MSEQPTIRDLVDAVLVDGRLTREEHQLLREAIMADGVIDDTEHDQLQRIMDMVDAGRLKIVDERKEETTD